MATASRAVRKIRRIKRERSLAFRLVKAFEIQRDQARMIAVAMEAELKKRDTPTEKAFTITKIEEPIVVE